MNITIEDIAKAVGGGVYNTALDARITSVKTDSREDYESGSLFIALKGDNFDGHDHINEAIKKGASCVLTEREIQDVPCIVVASTRRALLNLAAFHRRKHNAKVVAVTGSVGKTTTKDMIASVLSQKFNVLKTQGNRNNTIGLPLTLLNLSNEHDVAVLEMGMSHFGEIHDLSLTAAPDVAVITNIGDAHIEYLGSREGVLKAKLEITDGLAEDGRLILNGGDVLLTGLAPKFPSAKFVSISDVSGINLLGLDGTECVFKIGGENTEIFIPVPGAHMITNALLAAAVGTALGLTPGQIAAGIRSFTPTGRRMQVYNAGGMKIIDDAYNANTASMKAAVKTLADMNCPGRKVCVLGDMLELGSHAERLHKEIGEYVAGLNIDLVMAVGNSARFYVNNEANWFKNNAAFLNEWKNILRPEDTVLFKASLGMGFEEIIKSLTQGA